MSLEALKQKYKAEIAVAKANLDVLMHKAVGIGEHPQHLDELDKLISKIASAEGKKSTLHTHFKNKQI